MFWNRKSQKRSITIRCYVFIGVILGEFFQPTLRAETEPVEPALIVADINQDGDIDLMDLWDLTDDYSWLSFDYDPLFVSELDLTQDGIVNLQDFAVFAIAFQSRYDHLRQGLMCHLDFSTIAFDPNGSTPEFLVDLSGHGLDGVVQFGSFDTGAVGNAMYFDGDSSLVEVRDPDVNDFEATLGSLSQGTISVWFKFIIPTPTYTVYPILWFGDHQLFSKGNFDHAGLVIEVGHHDAADHRLFFTLYQKNSIPFCYDTDMYLEMNQWYHFVSVAQQACTDVYLNGQEITEHYNFGIESDPHFFANVAQKDVLWLGKGCFNYDSVWHFMDGAIDDLRIYNRPLRVEEVLELHQDRNADIN